MSRSKESDLYRPGKGTESSIVPCRKQLERTLAEDGNDGDPAEGGGAARRR